jgi:cell division protein FtsQ
MRFWHDITMLNRLTALLWLVLLGVVLSAAATWIARRPYFALQQIRVVAKPGTNYEALKLVTLPAIRANALPRLGNVVRANFFSVNLGQVRQAFETVPWVRKANVRRVWPHGLLVEIEEQQAVAIWGGDRLLNPRGEIFTANLDEAEADGALPQLSGPEGSSTQVLARFQQLTSWLAPLQLTVTELQLSPRYAWQVSLANGMANGMVMALGRDRTDVDMAARVQRFVQGYPELQKRLAKKFEYVDLRYTNGFAVRSKDIVLSNKLAG